MRDKNIWAYRLYQRISLALGRDEYRLVCSGKLYFEAVADLLVGPRLLVDNRIFILHDKKNRSQYR
jgi:hypothetical protein